VDACGPHPIEIGNQMVHFETARILVMMSRKSVTAAAGARTS
jgi:hypothetical protein